MLGKHCFDCAGELRESSPPDSQVANLHQRSTLKSAQALDKKHNCHVRLLILKNEC